MDDRLSGLQSFSQMEEMVKIAPGVPLSSIKSIESIQELSIYLKLLF